MTRVLPHATYLESALWTHTYGDIKEEVPPGCLESKMKVIDITVYFDASFACDLITRRPVTGIIVFLGSMPMRWHCKKQKTVESSTYGAKKIAGQLRVEAVLELFYVLRMLGVPIICLTRMLGDNMSVIQNCSLSGLQLKKKKNNAIAYHRISECIAAKIIRLGHVHSETKVPIGPALHGHGLCQGLLFSTDGFKGVSELSPTK